MKRRLTALTLILLFASATTRAQNPTFRTYTNIVYQFADGASLLMDIDVPVNQGPGPFPALICIHGGGWRGGGRGGVDGQQEARRGYVVVRIDYRLTGTWKFPENVRDVKVAVRFIKKKAALYKIDPNRVGLFGYSSGGHLAALAGASFGDAYLEGTKGYFEFDSSVKSIAVLSPPTDLSQVSDHPSAGCSAINTDAPDSFYYQLFGAPLSTIPDAVQLANPVTYLTSDDPPIFIIHGGRDCTVPTHQSQLLFDAYQTKGLDSTILILSGRDHNVSIYAPAVITPLRAFWDRTLKGN